MSCPDGLLTGSIPYVQIGRPSTLFVLSGGQAFMRMPGRERLRRDGARVKRLMPKGHGFTVFGYGPRHYVEAGLEGLADSFASILGCRSGPVQLVGISYGGLVAVRIAARHPGLVSDLVLVSSAAALSEEGISRVRRQIELASQRRYAELLSEFAGAFRRPWYKWFLKLRLLTQRTSLAGEMNAPDEITAYLRAGLAAKGPDISPWLKNITARTLVIGGERDQFFGQGMAETADAIRGARLHLLPNETHMAPVERPAEFRREIAAFLGGSGHRQRRPGPKGKV